MPSRLSKIFRRSEKEKEALAEAKHARSWDDSAPPEYAPEGYDPEHTLQPPDITAGFSNLSLKYNTAIDALPNVNECIAHLKVLECFYRLKQRIGSTDGLFGIQDSLVHEQTDHAACPDKAPELLAKLAEKRWAIYVTKAVDRFAVWSASVLPESRLITSITLQGQIVGGNICEPKVSEPALDFQKETVLPPADVLMVWHAYMLNPRCYLEDCIRLGRMRLWHTTMPWAAAAACVDSETFIYEVGAAAQAQFTSNTGLAWDSLADIGFRTFDCPVCSADIKVPWTTASELSSGHVAQSFDRILADVDRILSEGTGYCDKDFSQRCRSCSITITHERLKAGKFTHDLELLLNNDVPMGGTLLGLEGIPGKVAGVRDMTYQETTEIGNSILRNGLGRDILNNPRLIYDESTAENMDGVRSAIETAIKNRKYMRSVRGSLSSTMLPSEKIAIRRMMSRYWENGSMFALDLVGAVIRQGIFVEKMHGIDWLHSPALPSTMQRLLTKYSRFVGLMADRSRMAVPTLDVDLAWHTHQLSPCGYLHHTVKITKSFIDHNDKVAETALNDAFAWTTKTYQRLYGTPYSECTCWYCCSIREQVSSTAGRLFGTQSATVDDMLHDVPQDPRKSVHISAHNAVCPSDDTGKYAVEEKVKRDLLEAEYQSACKRARKKGKKEPRRDDYYYSDAYGYPVYIPAYSPYVGFVPYTPMYYPIAPGCMALSVGAVGNCCTGTCGGAVAAGGCAGGGGGACAGGSAGGCGAGGGCGGGGGGCGGGGGGS